jgi:hypothetical protein
MWEWACLPVVFDAPRAIRFVQLPYFYSADMLAVRIGTNCDEPLVKTTSGQTVSIVIVRRVRYKVIVSVWNEACLYHGLQQVRRTNGIVWQRSQAQTQTKIDILNRGAADPTLPPRNENH